jgi:hypothetical protein
MESGLTDLVLTCDRDNFTTHKPSTRDEAQVMAVWRTSASNIVEIHRDKPLPLDLGRRRDSHSNINRPSPKIRSIVSIAPYRSRLEFTAPPICPLGSLISNMCLGLPAPTSRLR